MFATRLHPPDSFNFDLDLILIAVQWGSLRLSLLVRVVCERVVIFMLQIVHLLMEPVALNAPP